MVEVAGGKKLDPLAGDLEQVAPLAERQGLGRADLDAARQLPLEKAGLAEGALHDPGSEGLVVLIGRNFERAGDHAITAPHAHRFIVDHGPVAVLGEGADETGGGAGRLQAMVALDLAVQRPLGARDVLIAVDHGVSLGIGAAAVLQHRQIAERLLRCGQLVDLVAGLFTLAAADAAGGVEKHPQGVRVAAEVRVAGGMGGPAHRRPDPCGAEPAEKPPA